MLNNCPVLVDDVDRCFKIYGKDVPSLKGKTVRKKGKRVVFEIVKVPMYILDKNRIIVLDVDIFYVNKIPFFTSLSRNMQFNTIQHVLNRKKITIYGAILLVCKIYGNRGFTVKVVNGDNEFACLKEDLLAIGITLNIATANEHCPFIE